MRTPAEVIAPSKETLREGNVHTFVSRVVRRLEDISTPPKFATLVPVPMQNVETGKSEKLWAWLDMSSSAEKLQEQLQAVTPEEAFDEEVDPIMRVAVRSENNEQAYRNFFLELLTPDTVVFTSYLAVEEEKQGNGIGQSLVAIGPECMRTFIRLHPEVFAQYTVLHAYVDYSEPKGESIQDGEEQPVWCEDILEKSGYQAPVAELEEKLVARFGDVPIAVLPLQVPSEDRTEAEGFESTAVPDMLSV